MRVTERNSQKDRKREKEADRGWSKQSDTCSLLFSLSHTCTHIRTTTDTDFFSRLFFAWHIGVISLCTNSFWYACHYLVLIEAVRHTHALALSHMYTHTCIHPYLPWWRFFKLFLLDMYICSCSPLILSDVLGWCRLLDTRTHLLPDTHTHIHTYHKHAHHLWQRFLFAAPICSTRICVLGLH